MVHPATTYWTLPLVSCHQSRYFSTWCLSSQSLFVIDRGRCSNYLTTCTAYELTIQKGHFLNVCYMSSMILNLYTHIAIYFFNHCPVSTTLIPISNMRKLRFGNITCSKSYCLQVKGSELESRPVTRGHAPIKHRLHGGKKSIKCWVMIQFKCLTDALIFWHFVCILVD